ncbi:MAG TPA: DUF4388 domain-containing protein [Anaeromyxobacteraceae bacterium]|nr:DUF4388 domain-containing protein [Anaeromyxobacteraceae bacterium]
MERHTLDIDAHGRVVPQSDEVRRALADRAGRFELVPSAPDLLVAVRSPAGGGPAPASRAVLAGDLAAFPLPDFVGFVHQARMTGALRVLVGPYARSIYFRDGQVRGASSEAPGERIGEVAVRLGFLDERQLTDAVASGRPVGRIFVERGHMTSNDLWKVVHEQVASVFHAVLMAREGTFYLLQGAFEEVPGAPLSVDTQGLLMDAIRRIDEMSHFRGRIPNAQVFLRRKEPRRQVALEPDEQRLLEMIDGRRRLADLARDGHVSEFDATKIVFRLAEVGYVEVSEAAAAQVAAPTDPARAVAAGMNDILRDIAGAVVAFRGAEAFLLGARAFLADPASRFGPLWRGASARSDGSVDEDEILRNLAALDAATVRKIEPTGERPRLLRDALRELMFFYLFQAGERLPRDADEAVSRSVKQKLEAIEGLLP